MLLQRKTIPRSAFRKKEARTPADRTFPIEIASITQKNKARKIRRIATI